MGREKMTFSPVRMGRAGEEIALQIEAAILDGRLEPGDGLPSERELQGRFGTGRGVVREALKALQQKGLVEIRKGARGGAFVKRMEVDTASESLALFLAQNTVDPGRIIEFRESIDRTVTVLAVARASEEDRRALLDGAEGLRDAALGRAEMLELVDRDRELNILLARMSGNPVFEWVMRAMQKGFGSHDFALYEDKEYRDWTTANWVDTARSIMDGDPLRALAFVANHYVLLRRRLAEDGAGGRGGLERS